MVSVEPYPKPNNLIQYLGIKHCYGSFDCITLVQQFYKQELQLPFDIPRYTNSRAWMLEHSIQSFDHLATHYFKKVLLTEAEDYDLISFKSDKHNLLTHFGMYIKPNKMLHVEEQQVSKLEQLSDYWVGQIHAVYRYDKVV